MIKGDNIAKLVSLLEARQVPLFHACQLTDYLAYLKIGGIPSRQRLVSNNNEFTIFDTDKADRVNGVWDKVFVNLDDFGRSFAEGIGATPNTYGPILLIIHPKALSESIDVAITLRSAGGMDFDREQESLSSIEEVERLFIYPQLYWYPDCTKTKSRKQLSAEFQYPNASYPEINCSFLDEIIPITFITCVVIDPYIFSETKLVDLVSNLTEFHELKQSIRTRSCNCNERIPIYNELANLLTDDSSYSQQLSEINNPSPGLKRWIQQIKRNKLEYQFARFAKYLWNGTIYPAQNMINR